MEPLVVPPRSRSINSADGYESAGSPTFICAFLTAARVPEPLARLEPGADYPVKVADALVALAAQADAQTRGQH